MLAADFDQDGRYGDTANPKLFRTSGHQHYATPTTILIYPALRSTQVWVTFEGVAKNMRAEQVYQPLSTNLPLS